MELLFLFMDIKEARIMSWVVAFIHENLFIKEVRIMNWVVIFIHGHFFIKEARRIPAWAENKKVLEQVDAWHI